LASSFDRPISDVSTVRERSAEAPKPPALPECDRSTVNEKSAQKIFDGYLRFCKEKKQDPRRCQVQWVNLYLRLTMASEKPIDLLGAIRIISDYHNKTVRL
jgi:hypothetical protein